MGKRLIYGILVFILLVVSGTAVWIYFGDMPKKLPVRAKQVYNNVIGSINSV